MIKTEEIWLNMGPQHPSTHGILRLLLKLDGEVIVDCIPHIGYLHRGMEKMAENRTYQQFIPLTDRLDYLASIFNNEVYVRAVEKLLGIEVPERAQYIRVIMMELNRIASHLVFVGSFGNDLGAMTALVYAYREREKAIDLLEMVTGARLTYNYMRIGGVAQDLPKGFSQRIKEFLKYMPPKIDELERLLTYNPIFVVRTKGIGILAPEYALQMGASGPVLRGSGVKFDLRRAEPYELYSRFDFQIPTGKNGDCLDRYLVRIEEMRQSLRIIEQALAGLPQGDIRVKMPRTVKPPAGESYARIESPRGDLGVYLVSDGSTKPYRVKIRTPSFSNLAVLPQLVRGWKVADVVAILGSLDPVLGEIDR